MSPQDLLPGLRAWFLTYLDGFSSSDPVVRENLDLKAEHTSKVCEAILDIGRSLHLREEDLALAEAGALLHDIGRFEQYSTYGTFADHRSVDHAALGAEIIRTSRVLDGLEPRAARIITRAVEYHNHAALPRGESRRFLFFLKLLRDADKLDIWRVVTGYYRKSGGGRNRTIELDLPDVDRVSPGVYEALMHGRLVQMTELETLNDFKLLQMGWIYDVNFERTFQIVKEKKYLEAIRSALPEGSSVIREIYVKALAHLNEGCNA
jgi:putative nucleotidyltransferase with HDIG domain